MLKQQKGKSMNSNSTPPLSPYEIGNVRPPFQGQRTAIKLQCLTVIFMLTAELAFIWLRPAIIAALQHYVSAFEAGPPDRRDWQQWDEHLTGLRHRLGVLSNLGDSCTGAQFACVLPFVATVLGATSRKQLHVRYFALLSVAIPLALGVYRHEITVTSVWLILVGKMTYHYMIIAFSACTLALNNVGGWKKPTAALSSVPLTFFATSAIQGNINSESMMYCFAVFPSILVFWSVANYYKLCFRGIH
ncbi:MAG: hypothetical protein JNL58_00180 [Planctomyces sp.]|nr:hypothetical protein [Planctomyces sp.]